ncbi:hypothetical protein Aduo_010446 [Ancylostoma duodenale]
MMFLIILSFAAMGACMDYSDFLGRNISLPLCAAAYSSHPSQCLRKRLSTSTIETFSAQVVGGSCSGLIVTLPEPKTSPTVALSFMANISEPTDFESFKDLFFPLVKWQHEGKVSKFLEHAYRNLWQNGEMKKRFQEIMKTQEYQEVLDIQITGDSFGGAVAALVAHDIVKTHLAKKDKVTLITLGQSMVGNKKFVEAYEKQVIHSYRVVRRGDSIPHVPGRENGYEYNGREVFYEKPGMKSDGITGFKVCESPTEKGCSLTQINPVRADDNDVYFRRNVTTYGSICK